MADITLQAFVGAADGVTHAFLSQAYPRIAQAIATPLYFAAVLYWALFGYKVYAGYAAVQWKDILAKCVMTVAVFSTLQWAGLALMIYNAFVSFMEGVAETVMAGQSTTLMLDALWKNVEEVSVALRLLDFYRISLILDGLMLFVVNSILMVIALMYMTIAKFGLAITMLLCPLFIGFLMFAETRQWFMNWVSQMLTFCFLYILVIAIVRFGFLAFGEAIDAAAQMARTNGAATSDQTSQLIIIEGVLVLFMLSVRSWAAALASGAASSTGTLIAIARTVISGGTGK